MNKRDLNGGMDGNNNNKDGFLLTCLQSDKALGESAPGRGCPWRLRGSETLGPCKKYLFVIWMLCRTACLRADLTVSAPRSALHEICMDSPASIKNRVLQRALRVMKMPLAPN